MKNFDNETKESILQRLAEFDAQKKEVLQKRIADPMFTARFLAKAKSDTLAKFKELEPVLEQFIKHVKSLKGSMGSITDRNIHIACYFLLGKITKTLRAALLLAQNGYYHEFMELARSINENVDLILLFVIEGEDGKNLKEWLDGKTISNGIARIAIQKNLQGNNGGMVADVDISDDLMKNMKTENYSAM